MTDSKPGQKLQSDEWSDDDARWTQWMAAAQCGDKEAYKHLLTEIETVIKRFLIARFGATEFIDDMVQECLLSIHKGRHTYDAKRPFRAWMFAIVRNRSVDFLRGWSGGQPDIAYRIESGDPPSTTPGEAVTLVEASLILSQLSREHRDVIVLVKYLGYSAREASAQLGISVASVRVRLHRAINRTRALLGDEDNLLI